MLRDFSFHAKDEPKMYFHFKNKLHEITQLHAIHAVISSVSIIFDFFFCNKFNKK